MSILKKIDKNKNIVVAVLILIAIIAAILVLKDTVMFDESEAIYGNRTDGIKKVKLTTEQVEKIKADLKDQTEKVEVKNEGMMINFIIYTKPEIDLATAKSMADTALATLTDEQKSFFDVQALIDNKSNQDQFPIIGYKHKSRSGYTWTRDREKQEG